MMIYRFSRCIGQTLKLTIIALTAVLTSCQQQGTHRPIGYHRISFPEKSYDTLSGNYPFECLLSKHSTIEKAPNSDTNQWYNIVYPKYNATIHLSYHHIDTSLSAYTETSRQFAMQHIPKATAIRQNVVSLPEHSVYGICYNIQGSDAASPIQFYLTDSTHNFLRGALYFNNTPNNDSVAPVIEYINDDLVVLMESLRWK